MADGSGDIEMTKSEYKSDLGPGRLCDGTSTIFSTKHSWAMFVLRTPRATILSSVPVDFMLDLTSFIARHFVAEGEMVTVSQSENQVLVEVLGNTLAQTTLPLPEAPYVRLCQAVQRCLYLQTEHFTGTRLTQEGQ